MSWQLLVFSGSITTNFKMTEYLTNSVMDRDESQIKKFRNAKKQIIKRAECWRSCGLIN